MLELVADSKNATYLAQHAVTMASEALIKASTNRSTEEAMGLDDNSSQTQNVVPFSSERRVSDRQSYFDTLGEDPIKA